MGCDIHGMFERKNESCGRWWVNAGDPDIGRDYEMFSVLGNVRNDSGIPFIGKRRIDPKNEERMWDFSDAFSALVKSWDGDGHSHSYVTLAEMKAYDTNQKYHDTRLVLGRDGDRITATCAATTASHLGEVGETTVFGVFGVDRWHKLIAFGENIRARNGLTDEEVRYCFFFDN